MKTIEYRVRPVTRYVVTRYESGGVETLGEFANEGHALRVMLALQRHDPELSGDLELSSRTKNCLRANDISTLVQLCRMTPSDLLRIPNLGMRSLNEIVLHLGLRGLTLASG